VESRREILPAVAEALAKMRETVETLLKEPNRPNGGDRKSPEFQSNNITLIPPPEQRGTSQEYTVRRLLRDRPDLAERVIAGELSPPRISV